MDFTFIFYAGAAIYAIVASVFDFRLRIIPDWLNYGAVVVAVGLAAVSGKLNFDYALFVAWGFVFSYALYKLGAWAGGDVKFFTGASAWFALIHAFNPLQLIAVFIASAVLTLPVAMVWYGKRILQNKHLLEPLVPSSIKNGLYGGAVAGVTASISYTHVYVGILAGVILSLILTRSKWQIAVFASAAALVYQWQQFVYGFAGGLLIVGLTTFVLSGFAAIAPYVLRRNVPVGELAEGDIPYSSVYLDKEGNATYWNPPTAIDVFKMGLNLDAEGLGNLSPPPNPTVNCLDAGGVTVEQINELKKAKGVTRLVVKESLPFAPAIALGFIVVAAFL